MNIQHTIVSLDFLLLKAFAPAIGKLAQQILLEGAHFRFVQRLLQPNRGAAHQFPVRSSTEGMALSTFALTPGVRCSEK